MSIEIVPDGNFSIDEDGVYSTVAEFYYHEFYSDEPLSIMAPDGSMMKFRLPQDARPGDTIKLNLKHPLRCKLMLKEPEGLSRKEIFQSLAEFSRLVTGS